MNLKQTIVFVSLALSAHPLWAGNVIGYFTNWGIYGDRPYTAEDVPYEKLTHIQYAFFNPQTNGEIASFDQDADDKILLGKMVWYPVTQHDSTTSLIYLAHQKNVKVLASIGGWTGSSNFPALASAASSRSNFCSKARALIEKYRFDGIDIDWEFPGYTEHNGTPADAQNFVLLLAELRDTLDATPGAKKLITLAIAASPYHGDNYLIEQFFQDVDYISIMTYDYTGIWGSYAWHSSPLYDYGNTESWSLSRSMEYYISRGVPASKFNIGMAFYGKTFSGCIGPNATFTGAGSESGSMDYCIIEKKISDGDYVRYWDTAAMVPYCLSAANEYCSYDDTISIRKKAEYCADNGYAGAIIWELKGGTLPDKSSPLLDAAAKVLLPKVSAAEKNPVIVNNLELSQVNSDCTKPVVRFSVQKTSNITFSICNLSGRNVREMRKSFQAGYHEIRVPGTDALKSGRYVMVITSEKKSTQHLFNIIK